LQGDFKELPETDFNKLKTVIEKYGFKYPLYLWEDKKGLFWNLDGNQRVRVVQKVYGTDVELPYIKIFAENKKEAKKQILAISSEYGKVSKDSFDIFTGDLDLDEIKKEFAFDKFFDVEIEPEVLETEGDDEIPTEPKNIFVVRGDIFEIKANDVTLRIGCLDSCNSDDIEKLMNDSKADMSINDVPYGVEYQSNGRVKSKKFDVLQNDDKLLDFLPVESLFCKGFLFVWTSWKILKEWIEIVENHYEITNQIIWNKGGGGLGDLEKTFATDYEIAICCNRGNKITNKRIGSVWNVTKDNPNSYLHPTQKPVEIIEIAINHTTNINNNVLDMFCGSGTTALACLKTKRNCFTNDISENYVQVAVKRIIDFCEKNSIKFDITLNNTEFDINLLN
jgi:site-specific DNA-methyltransferase (adenine-specific)